MKYLKLPASDAPWYSYRTTLSKVRYTLGFRYNKRMDRWILNISDANGTPILLGIPLLINHVLTRQYTNLALPPGALFVIDNSGANQQPGISSFLKDHQLIYADPTQ